MVDLDGLIRTLAKEYGFEEADLRAVQDLLRFDEQSYAVRLNQIAMFAQEFGVNVRSLAEFVQRSTTGIEPWEADDDISREDWGRIRDAIAERATPGDWAHTILSFLNEGQDTPGPR
jgi:hypothetical protein